ncbi:MAG: FliH/SctL family protein [Roseinatronobacter sp.]
MTVIFDRDFDLELAREDQSARRLMRARHTDEDLSDAVAAARDAAFQEGRALGHAEGVAEAATAQNARRAEALQALGPTITELVQANECHRAALEAQVLDFAITVCEQVFPELLRHRAHDRVLAQVRRALEVGLGSVSLRIFLSPEAVHLLREDLNSVILQSGLEGRVELRADPALCNGDARVDWDSGFLEYSFSSICDRILCALHEARSAAPTPIAER